jgi:hypothetical protein
MPVTRLAHFANAADVDTVVVDGKVLMQSRKTHLDEAAILDGAEREANLAFERGGLSGLRSEPQDFWKIARKRRAS